VTTRRLVPRAAALVVTVGLVTGGFALALSDEAAHLVQALALREGMHVADVGAGEGEWVEPLAEEVGAAGHVYATEIDPDDVADIEGWARREGRGNVTAILGTATDTGLPDGCCDAVLLRMVYHHFTDPAPMRASLRRALRPGARLAVIDLSPRSDWGELPGVPERGGHGIAEEDLVAEMTSGGFEVVDRYDEWAGNRNRYCVVFRRAEDPGGSRADGGQEER
jgi:ubiquinone/menaquinone biosynthesis C-methylase UbiE